MAEWKCKCGKQNPLRIRECSCGQTIPQTEIRRIANLELENLIQETRRKRNIKKTNFYKKLNVFLQRWPQWVLTVCALVFFLVIVGVDNREVSFYTDRAIGLADQTVNVVQNVTKVSTSAAEKLSLLVSKGYGSADENLVQAISNVWYAIGDKISLLAEKIDATVERVNILRKEVLR